MLAILLTLIWQTNQQLTQITQLELPQLKVKEEVQQFQIETNQLYAQLAAAETADEFQHFQQGIRSRLQTLAANKSLPSLSLARLLADVEKNGEQLLRFSRNSNRNIQLKQNSIIQIQLVLDSLDKLIVDKEQRQLALYQQIISDRVNDRVTANRARAHAKVIQELSILRQLHKLLARVLSDFYALNIHTSLNLFELTSDKLEQSFVLFSQLVQSEDKDLLELNEQLDTLDKLLLSEQRTLAKWRGHLRLAEEYLSQASRLQEALKGLSYTRTLDVVDREMPLTKVLNKAISGNDQLITDQQVQQAQLVFLILLFAAFGYLLMRIRLHIRSHGEQSYALYKQLVEQGEPSITPLSSENIEVSRLIGQIQRPEHTESDYQAIVADFQQQLSAILSNHGVAFWSLKDGEPLLKNKVLQSLLAKEAKAGRVTSWRQWFEKSAVEKLLAAARAAKTSQESQSLRVKSVDGKGFLICIGFEQGFQGTIADNQVVEALDKLVENLHTDILELKQRQLASQLSANEEISKMLIAALLQAQSNLAESEAMPWHRQIKRIYDWAQQGKVSAQLRLHTEPLRLSDVHFQNEVSAAAINALAEANSQRNQVLLDTSPMLAQKVRLDLGLFHFTLQTFCRLLLAKQLKSRLVLKLQLADKKAGQQIVRFSGYLDTNKAQDCLPADIEALVAQETSHEQGMAQSLRDAFSRLHVSNVSAELKDNGYQVGFDMPLAIAEQQAALDSIDLKQANIVLVSADAGTRALVCKEVKEANGLIEALANPDYFAKQLSIKHLNRKAVDIVILAADCLVTAHDNVRQHIQSLPAGLQPKLMVMQPAYQSHIATYGLYSLCNYPFCARTLLNELSALIHGEQRHNRLVEPEKFKGLSFLPTQVEVLLACAEPNKFQPLACLLSWLGLHITFVTHPQSMRQEWQTGRYLILLTEFEASPYIQLSQGNSVQRTVFSLSQGLFEQLPESERKIADKWHSGLVPEITKVDEILSLFSPWLKRKQRAKVERQPKAVISPEGESANLDASDLELLVTTSDDKASFDLQRYAANQGTPEMAALMLDEYVQSNCENFARLSQACADHDIDKALECLVVIKQNARIMAADALLLTCLSAEKAIDEDITQLAAQLKPMAEEITAIETFADAI